MPGGAPDVAAAAAAAYLAGYTAAGGTPADTVLQAVAVLGAWLLTRRR